MKTVTQQRIADFLGISVSMLNDIKQGRRHLSKKKAEEVAEKTGIPFADLCLTNGDQLFRKLVMAYQIARKAA